MSIISFCGTESVDLVVAASHDSAHYHLTLPKEGSLVINSIVSTLRVLIDWDNYPFQLREIESYFTGLQ